MAAVLVYPIAGFLLGLAISYFTRSRAGMYVGLIAIAGAFLSAFLLRGGGFLGFILFLVVATVLALAGLGMLVGGWIGYRLSRRRTA